MSLDTCIELRELSKEQIRIIERHINEHKYFKHIENKEEAINDFVYSYGWVMREAYCDQCKHNKECIPYKLYLSKYPINSNSSIM